MHDVSIIIPTYNRLNLLKKAIQSCLTQTNKNFNLLIIDNCSNDGTKDYLESLYDSDILMEVIINEKNLGATSSIEKAINSISTKWITILSDDDYLEPTFIEDSLVVLEKTTKGIVSVGFKNLDKDYMLKREFLFKKEKIDRSEAMIRVLDGTLAVAGISGFFFLSEKTMNGKMHSLKYYPKGFFTDMMLAIHSIVEYNGIEIIDKVLYNRLQWEESESSFSLENWKLFFEALLMFGNDLKVLRYQYDFSEEAKEKMDKVLPFKIFMKSFFLPIFFRSSMEYQDVFDFKRIITKYDTRYIKYYRFFLLALPFMTRYTFIVRKYLFKLLQTLHRFRK